MIKVIFASIFILVALWVVASYGEVLSKNMTPDPTYHPLNVVVLFSKG